MARNPERGRARSQASRLRCHLWWDDLRHRTDRLKRANATATWQAPVAVGSGSSGVWALIRTPDLSCYASNPLHRRQRGPLHLNTSACPLDTFVLLLFL